MASKVEKKKTPIERDGWDKWYEDNLCVLEECLTQEKFKDFGSELHILMNRLKKGYAEIEQENRNKKQHRKRDAVALKKLAEQLRDKNFFRKEYFPYFLTEMLIKFCKHESSYTYSGGARPKTILESIFIADLATLLFKYTGKPFEYGKQDLLCKTASSCFVGLGKKESLTAVVSQIKTAVQVNAVKKENIFSGIELKNLGTSYKRFDYNNLKQTKHTPSSLPQDYKFIDARENAPRPKMKADRKDEGFSESIFNLMKSRTLAPLQELINPYYGLWISYLNERAAVLRDNRATLISLLATEFVRENDWKQVFDENGRFLTLVRKCLIESGEEYSQAELSYHIKSSVGIKLQLVPHGTPVSLKYDDFLGDRSTYESGIFKDFFPVYLKTYSLSTPFENLRVNPSMSGGWGEEDKERQQSIVGCFQETIKH